MEYAERKKNGGVAKLAVKENANLHASKEDLEMRGKGKGGYLMKETRVLFVLPGGKLKPLVEGKGGGEKIEAHAKRGKPDFKKLIEGVSAHRREKKRGRNHSRPNKGGGVAGPLYP